MNVFSKPNKKLLNEFQCLCLKLIYMSFHDPFLYPGFFLSFYGFSLTPKTIEDTAMQKAVVFGF